MHHRIRTFQPGVWAVALATTVACGGGPANEGRRTASIVTVDGSSTVAPVTEAVAEDYREATGVAVTVGTSGTGGGFQKFCRGETDISDASRPISSNEVTACADGGVGFIEIPVAYDGLAVVVHPNNSWVTSMTVDDLRRIWEPAAQGKIMRWNQIRPNWPDREIHLFGPGVDSGTFDYFTEVIVGKSKASRGDYTSSEDDNVIVQGVTGDEGALGYFGFAYYEQNQARLKIVPIDDEDDSNGSGPIAPTPETVKNGTYRPLSRPIFIYPKVQALDRQEVRDFVDFYLTKGVPLVREVGYIPLSDREYELVRRRFAEQKTGSMYAGADGHAQLSLEERLVR
jgi:phosphate transport system substrate-binding protein